MLMYDIEEYLKFEMHINEQYNRISSIIYELKIPSKTCRPNDINFQIWIDVLYPIM